MAAHDDNKIKEGSGTITKTPTRAESETGAGHRHGKDKDTGRNRNGPTCLQEDSSFGCLPLPHSYVSQERNPYFQAT